MASGEWRVDKEGVKIAKYKSFFLKRVVDLKVGFLDSSHRYATMNVSVWRAN